MLERPANCTRAHLHQISEAELEAQIPPHAQHDDLTIKVTALEEFVQTQELSHLTAFNSPEDGMVERPANCTRALLNTAP